MGKGPNRTGRDRELDNLLSKIMIFEKNPFTAAVSIPQSFHMTPFSPTFEIHQPTLVINICKILVEEYFLEIKRSFKKSILIMFQNV